MAWYGQKNYSEKLGNGPYTIAEIGCFLTSFSNLMQKFGSNSIPPDQLNSDFVQRGVFLLDPEDGPGVRDDLGWNSVTAINGQIKVGQVVDHGLQRTAGWPDTSNAIVKFYYQSISHPWLDSAHTRPNMITHFCLVADQNAHTIVDSWDGVIKGVGAYGQPVAYATYEYVVPQPVTPPPAPVAVSSPSSPAAVAPAEPTPATPSPRPGTQYKFQKGDTFFSIAARFSKPGATLSAVELMDYNDVTDQEAHNIPVGFMIYIPPSAEKAPASTGYTVEALPEPKVYHITRSPSANKWAFGNIKSWADFKSNGSTPVNTNVTITAVATVIVGKETAAYYMDQLAYANGEVINTIGYNWADLAEGAYEAPAAPETPAPATPATTIAISNPDNAEISSKPAEVTGNTDQATDTGVSKDAKGQISPSLYKATYDPFPKATIYEVIKTVNCPECDGRRPDHQLTRGQAVSIIGTFVKGQTLYGRPTGAAKAGLWFGVPMDALELQEKIFAPITTAEKQLAGGVLTLDQRFTTVLADVKKLLKIKL